MDIYRSSGHGVRQNSKQHPNNLCVVNEEISVIPGEAASESGVDDPAAFRQVNAKVRSIPEINQESRLKKY